MRIINAPLNIAFGKVSADNEAKFRAEFDRLSENNDDPISAWIRTTRARGRVIDENEPILQLLVELHRKIDALSAQINNESKNYISLESHAVLEAIGHNLLIFGADLASELKLARNITDDLILLCFHRAKSRCFLSHKIPKMPKFA